MDVLQKLHEKNTSSRNQGGLQSGNIRFGSLAAGGSEETLVLPLAIGGRGMQRSSNARIGSRRGKTTKKKSEGPSTISASGS